jgi:hypothetical protein
MQTFSKIDLNRSENAIDAGQISLSFFTFKSQNNKGEFFILILTIFFFVLEIYIFLCDEKIDSF